MSKKNNVNPDHYTAGRERPGEDVARDVFWKKQWNVFAVVIDDDQDQTELIKEVLAPEGYCVLTADNAKGGLRLSQDYHPFVIITDFGIPGLNGAGLVERLRVNGTSCPCSEPS